VAAWLAPWTRAAPPVETLFLLIEKGWFALLIWMGLIVWSRRAEARVAATADPVTATAADVPPLDRAASEAQRPAAQAPLSEWVLARQHEQKAEALQAQRSLIRRLALERSLWGGMALLSLGLLGGLVLFCFAFGMPILGGFSADALLSASGCKPAPGISAEALGPFCGFWIERLAPYRQPFLGALLAPLWLFTQFYDLLLAWCAAIVVLMLLPLYRLGWTALALKEQTVAVRVVFVLIALSSIGMMFSLALAVPG